MADLVTIAEYAKLRGVPPDKVHRLVANGTLPAVETPAGRMVDPDAADAAWGIRRERLDTPPARGAIDDLRESRARRERAMADRAEQHAAKMRGELVAKADVAKDIADAVAIFYSGLEGLPDRLAPGLLNIGDLGAARAMIADELEVFSTAFVAALGRAAEGGSA